jgi:hypothetical protein
MQNVHNVKVIFDPVKLYIKPPSIIAQFSLFRTSVLRPAIFESFTKSSG